MKLKFWKPKHACCANLRKNRDLPFCPQLRIECRFMGRAGLFPREVDGKGGLALCPVHGREGVIQTWFGQCWFVFNARPHLLSSPAGVRFSPTPLIRPHAFAKATAGWSATFSRSHWRRISGEEIAALDDSRFGDDCPANPVVGFQNGRGVSFKHSEM